MTEHLTDAIKYMPPEHQSLTDDKAAIDYHEDVVEKSMPVTFKMGERVRGTGKKYSWLRGTIIGINAENNSYGVRTKEGAITALYSQYLEKD